MYYQKFFLGSSSNDFHPTIILLASFYISFK